MEQLVINVDRRDDIRIFRDSMVRAGMLTAGDVSFDSGARAAARVGEDRWTVELKVPAESLGGVIRDGERWLMDVYRARKPG